MVTGFRENSSLQTPLRFVFYMLFPMGGCFCYHVLFCALISSCTWLNATGTLVCSTRGLKLNYDESKSIQQAGVVHTILTLTFKKLKNVPNVIYYSVVTLIFQKYIALCTRLVSFENMLIVACFKCHVSHFCYEIIKFDHKKLYIYTNNIH